MGPLETEKYSIFNDFWQNTQAMKIISKDDPQSISEVATVLAEGGVVVYPTDTAYGLGVDPRNSDAVAKLRKIKGRSDTNPIPVVVSDLHEAQNHVIFSESAQKLADTFWPGALTLVLPSKNLELSENIGGSGTVGIRVPNEKWLLKFLQEAGMPLTSTSANKTGDPAQYSLEDVKKSLGENAALVDVWIDGGVLEERPTSTVITFENDTLAIKREGAITREEIAKVLG